MINANIHRETIIVGNELVEIDLCYFKIIRETGSFIEIMSKNTKHCWLIQKKRDDDNLIILHHKHSMQIPYYHKQKEVSSVAHAMKLIKGHDRFVLQQRV